MPEEHVVNVIMGRPPTTKGHISYTRPTTSLMQRTGLSLQNSYSKFSELDFNIIVRLKIYQFEKKVLNDNLDN